MTIRGLRTGPGAEASQSGVVIGRVMSTGAGELEEFPLATLDARLTAAASPIAITGAVLDRTGWHFSRRTLEERLARGPQEERHSRVSALLSAPLLGGRVLELTRETRGLGYRLAVVQIDGNDRRQVGGFTVTRAELPLVLASLRAMTTHAQSRAA